MKDLWLLRRPDLVCELCRLTALNFLDDSGLGFGGYDDSGVGGGAAGGGGGMGGGGGALVAQVGAWVWTLVEVC